MKRTTRRVCTTARTDGQQKGEGGRRAMLKRFLFETWIGDRLLAIFERLTGLMIMNIKETA
jgi:hypothetical protein